MLIIPALYLQHGRCVSLYKGQDNEQKKVYSNSPLKLAAQWENQGVTRFHLIDIDHSMGTDPKKNHDVIAGICQRGNVPVEVGGGVRTLEGIEALFTLGVQRVVLGVSARGIIPDALAKYGPERIVFGIKARKSFVESDSLPEDSDEVLEIAEQVIAQGITEIVYKDMEREGTLYHPNYDEIERLIYFMKPGIKIYSSGGVTDLSDLKILSDIGTQGVLIGRALMEHQINLREALERYPNPVA